MQRDNINCNDKCPIRVNPLHFNGTNLAGDLGVGKDGAIIWTFNLLWKGISKAQNNAVTTISSNMFWTWFGSWIRQ